MSPIFFGSQLNSLTREQKILSGCTFECKIYWISPASTVITLVWGFLLIKFLFSNLFGLCCMTYKSCLFTGFHFCYVQLLIKVNLIAARSYNSRNFWQMKIFRVLISRETCHLSDLSVPCWHFLASFLLYLFDK